MNSSFKLIALPLLWVTAWGHSANANGLIAYEPFDYPLGAFANGTPATGSGFTGNWLVQGTGASTVAGLTYPDLTVNNNAFRQNPNGRDQVSLANPLSSGSVYISWLFNLAGNNGADYNGLFLPGDGATSLFAGFTGAWSGSAGNIGLASIVTTSATGTGGSSLAQMPGPDQIVNYGANNLMVLQIDFNTSGVNDTINLWVNPIAGVASPAGNINAPNPSLTVTSYNVGAIAGIGFNLQGGGQNVQFDELRVGSTYGEVVTVPEPSMFALLGFGALALCLARRRCRSKSVTAPPIA